MPILNCTLNGKPGYKWGNKGKCYTYTPGNEKSRKEAKQKAYKQGAAIDLSVGKHVKAYKHGAAIGLSKTFGNHVLVPHWVNGESQTGPCDVCAALDGLPIWDWPEEHRSGPPSPHPRCVCSIEYIDMTVDDVIEQAYESGVDLDQIESLLQTDFEFNRGDQMKTVIGSNEPIVIRLASNHVANLINTKEGIRFKKEIISCGTFLVSSNGPKFTIGPETLDHWVNTFNLMVSNGVKVTVPPSHEATDKNMGWVIGLERRGDKLIGEFLLTCKDARNIAHSNDVSLYSPPSFKDGKGNVYTRPIVHIALTPTPQIPGLGPWEEIAASRSIVTLSRESKMPINWKDFSEKLGVEVTEENAVDVILSKVTELTEIIQKKEDELKTLTKPTEPAEKKLDPILLSLARENLELKLSSICPSKICPATKDKIEKAFLSEEWLTIALSRNEGKYTLFETLIEALRDNKVVPIGEHTGPQTLKLAHNLAPGENPLVKDAEARAKNAS